jgi:hypothetical protein
LVVFCSAANFSIFPKGLVQWVRPFFLASYFWGSA